MASLLFLAAFCTTARGQESTSTELWPIVEAQTQLRPDLRLLMFGGLEQGEDVDYSQWNTGLGFGYQLKPILKSHLSNIDADKEHYLVFAAGYEYLRTTQPAKTKNEDRIVLEAISHFRPTSAFLLEDRNRVELR
jgi:hypothetical protein